MKPLKICFFVPFYPMIAGGAEYQSKLIASNLRDRGHEVFFISGGHQQEELIEQDGFKIYTLTVKPTPLAKISLYKGLLKKITKITDRECPDVIYQRILNSFTFRLARHAHKKQTPFVLHIADNYSVEFSNSIKGTIKNRMLKRILGFHPYIICQTPYQEEKIREEAYSNITIIPNMHPIIATEVSHKNKRQIVWIGNARPVKQLEKYLDLSEQPGMQDYLFKVIGNIPDSSYGDNLMQRMGHIDNIEYLGFRENDYINKLLSESGLLINTSVSEGFSNTFLQAWMCGTPVLAFNTDPGGVMKRHKLGVDCKGDSAALEPKVIEILSTEDYGAWCFEIRTKAQELFSTDKVMDKFESVLALAIK